MIASYGQISYIEALVNSSILNEVHKQLVESYVEAWINEDKASELIEYLRASQPNIREIGAASQTEIKEQTP